MSLIFRRASRERVAKRSLSKSKTESFGVSEWLEDLEGYRTLVHRILQGKGVDYGWL